MTAYFRRATLVHHFRCSTFPSVSVQDREARSSSPFPTFLTFSDRWNVPCTAVDSTLQVLLSLAHNDTFGPTAQSFELQLFAALSIGESPEMNVFTKRIVLRAASMLMLQLAVISSAQQIAPLPGPAPDTSASPSKTARAESSQNQDRPGAVRLADGAITQPGKVGGKGDPAFGGERHPLYRLSKSDVLDVNFTFSPDFNQSLTVQPDGFVALKGAGTLLVEGLTVPEVQQAVAGAYRSFLREPEVTVTLKDFDKPYFLASGEVARPGKYELRGDLTAAEAVAIAGGFTQQARHSQVVVFRRISAYVAESHVLDLKKMLGSHDLSEDFHLQPGDFIYVPQSRISKIRKFVPTNSMSWYVNPLQF
jgi:protein involved in polysaccharide export with SLBB domain